MIIDIITLVLLVIALIKGFSKGLIVALFSFLAFVIGLAAALKLSSLVADYLGNATSISQRWLPVLAFLIVFIVVVLLVRLGAKAIEAAMKLAMLGWLNRLGGVLFFILLYLLVYSIALFYIQKLGIIRPETAESSVSYEFIAALGPWMINALAYILPFFGDMFSGLSDFFDGFAKKQGS